MAERKKYNFLLGILFLFLTLSCKTAQDTFVPDPEKYPFHRFEKIVVSDSIHFVDKNSLRLNRFGQWEVIASGNPLQLGYDLGDLTSELTAKQEAIFFKEVEALVPSKFGRYFLRKFLAWFTRDMEEYVTEEYRTELFGISRFLPDTYDYIADKYHRSLYLHAAHDIGHALKDLALVGCTSFAVWGPHTPDGELLVARVFDFNIGDEFAREKTISFIEPEKGYRFVSVSWAGFIGVMSGMNEKGITVTINAGRSDIPKKAKTPVSLVAREIVQYAKNLEEAIAIAKKKQVFVSESIMVGSAEDNRAVLIEISPEKFGVYEVKNQSELLCSNHFQSTAYTDDPNNIKQIAESHSQYRYDKLNALINTQSVITPEHAVQILRERKGLKNKLLGMGNEKAINQLAAHHAVVFLPKKRLIWVSSNPYQLGDFVAFQLDSVFKNRSKPLTSLSLESKRIEKDPFLDTQAFKNFESYKKLRKKILNALKNDEHIALQTLETFKRMNPEFWEVYYLSGLYLYRQNYYLAALKDFETALAKEVTTIPDKERIEDYIKHIKRKIGDTGN